MVSVRMSVVLLVTNLLTCNFSSCIVGFHTSHIHVQNCNTLVVFLTTVQHICSKIFAAFGCLWNCITYSRGTTAWSYMKCVSMNIYWVNRK